MRELGDRSTEKLVRGMQRMGFCRILSNGLVLGQAAVSQLVLDLHAAGSAELHLRDVARILSLSRNSTRALVDALAEDGSVEKISETVVRVPDEA
jgi:predicted transcriptional regulator of viral defense system